MWAKKRILLVVLLATVLIDPLLLQNTFSQSSSLEWRKPVAIIRKPNVGSRPRKQIVPLLTLQWQVLKRAQAGKIQATNPLTLFHSGDQLRLAIKVNQEGYLYIIHQTEGQPGTIVFPDSRIDNGQNYVKKDQECIIPNYCPSFKNAAEDCWWTMDNNQGKEIFTVIFSRDLPISLKHVIEAGGIVEQKFIDDLKIKSGQQLKYNGQKTGTFNTTRNTDEGRYITFVSNINQRDNEELIETIVLNHGL